MSGSCFNCDRPLVATGSSSDPVYCDGCGADNRDCFIDELKAQLAHVAKQRGRYLQKYVDLKYERHSLTSLLQESLDTERALRKAAEGTVALLKDAEARAKRWAWMWKRAAKHYQRKHRDHYSWLWS